MNELAATVRHSMRETVSDRARRRIREEMARKNLNQRDVADLLLWKESRLSKVMNGRIALGLEELHEVSFAVGLALTEVVRDHGLEFCAEMTPTELRFLERIRQLDQPSRDAFMQILDVKSKTRAQERRALPVTKKVRTAR